jgi:hypothetical protein
MVLIVNGFCQPRNEDSATSRAIASSLVIAVVGSQCRLDGSAANIFPKAPIEPCKKIQPTPPLIAKTFQFRCQ